MVIKFNVFGKLMSVHRIEQQWQLFNDSDTGISSRVYDVVIPPELTPDELAGYLDDIYHEYANDKSTEVIQLT
ncbi:hypothetical protein [Thalassomonas sp. RHCl1]|uniref:DUF7661 family protein n=1 Tax=Thalassomonas sp. RHCl1 TaxID=2995320 RepID=UPI00248B92AB|nr:hypothetical protein [Thalassomonas sp. RHCl1]